MTEVNWHKANTRFYGSHHAGQITATQ